MKNFLKIADQVDVLPLLLELQRQPQLWDRNPYRLREEGPHRETHDIWLHYKDEAENKERGDYSNFRDPHDGVWYPAYYALPAARPLIFGLMSRVEGERLGGVLIYSVPPGKRIYPHVDTGWHVDYFEKFNVCLQSNPKARFHYTGNGETMIAQRGDTHWFVNNVEHEVINYGDNDHIVLTVCIHTHNYSARAADAS
jgi:quercetin dioxygenase-like cupin family protein